MKLSIIVPVYNMAGDNKLSFCLDSLVAQTIGDYEIIAVNDASTDNSLEVLRSYEAKYPDKVRVIDGKINRHQGGARNEGIKAAAGEWIGFIDSDDWITPDYYEKLISKGEETGADVVGCGYTIVHSHTFEKGKEIRDILPEQTGIQTPERKKLFLAHNGSMVMKVYRASLIRENELSFPENIFYEDNCAGPVWAMCFKHFEYVDESMYYYYQHGASTIHTITAARCNDRVTAAEMMLEEMRARGFLADYRTEIESAFITSFFINTLFSYMRMKKGRKLSFVKHLRDRMLEEFPEFRNNPEYKDRTDEEQRKYADILIKSPLWFFVQYSLLWKYRDLKASRH
ncbi:MAG: glycosyltransferase [Lachnospiraceae bacterium]|nr:glycosyltransferase [Lachnospiraceae bacterium]